MKKALIIALAIMMIALPVFAQGSQEAAAECSSKDHLLGTNEQQDQKCQRFL